MEINRSLARIVVADFKSTFRFYRNTVGLPVDFGTEDDLIAEFDAGTVILTIVDQSVMTDVPVPGFKAAGKKEGDRFVLVFQVEDFDGAVRELMSRGGTFSGEPVSVPDWHMRVVHLRDPEGNLIEIQSMPE